MSIISRRAFLRIGASLPIVAFIPPQKKSVVYGFALFKAGAGSPYMIWWLMRPIDRGDADALSDAWENCVAANPDADYGIIVDELGVQI